ncbi:MAG: YgiQ family radical SAM protein [Elusimicrobia bacterium]|nr:YgiQ family radical SAM protein [Elusimicrobiota bacterium]
MYLPTTKEEALRLGWDKLDIVIITGDAYIDSPFIGAAVIGNYLAHYGFKVGVIAQPSIDTPNDIKRLGEPSLYWGVTAGSVDSMVANFTATKKFRKQDDLTPGGINLRRPDRASIIYTNLIRSNFKNTKPIILGGIEASLRRIAHYDYWNDKIRRSILFDAKADAIVYGMGEKAALEIAQKLSATSWTGEGEGVFKDIKGICYSSSAPREGYMDIPSFEEVSIDKNAFIEMFDIFYRNNDPVTARGLYQRHGNRCLIQNPPQPNLTTAELDEIYELSYERNLHPYYRNMGRVRAMDTITFSVTTHRGCYGECNFCSIGMHQGRTVISRSEESIIKEVENITKLPGFTGFIADVGGPTANMYGIECPRQASTGACTGKRCLFPEICETLQLNHGRQIELLKKLRSIPGVKKIFVGSGIRYDMVVADKKSGNDYLNEIVEHHVSGQIKIAPEHCDEQILNLMGKPDTKSLKKFIAQFNDINKRLKKNQFMTYYFIAAHPGCTMQNMRHLKDFVSRELKLKPEQVQIFTPTPSCWSTVMYWTGINPFTGKPLFVEKNDHKKDIQKAVLKSKPIQPRRLYGKRK